MEVEVKIALRQGYLEFPLYYSGDANHLAKFSLLIFITFLSYNTLSVNGETVKIV